MYTTWELRGKLQKEGFPKEVVEEALAFLSERGYLNDRLYASTYIEEKRQVAPRGYFAFYHELKSRGIPSELLSELRDMYPLEAEVEDAKGLLLRWGVKEKEKLWQRLLRRGFSHEAIERAILDLRNSGD
ncbi:MAG: RecX family transcriptional regulator [Candidatus Caldatribacterium sp.]|nr:RecX family transcriptional regulator [Candidatus Caldatribacterium sp.]